MLLKELHILNFKNIREATLALCPGFNCLTGNNGEGKTNVLDAIYQLSICKSYFGLPDSQNIRHGEAFFVLQGKYERSGEEAEIYCGVKNGRKKTFRKDGKEYGKLSEHIGFIPLVMIAPEDVVLIEGGSEERRKLMDGIICQCDRDYLYALIRYNKALLQRNSFLKSAAGTVPDPELIEVWNEQLAEHGERIREGREHFLKEFGPVFQHYYEQLSAGKERVGLSYHASVKPGEYVQKLKDTLEKDRMLAYTTAGVHRDDLHLCIDDYPVKKVGSQGQKKTFLIALKLAQYAWLHRAGSLKPLLLLDDIFDKLDAERVGAIIRMVGEELFGQIFLTDTNREHISAMLQQQQKEYRLFRVEQGRIVQEPAGELPA